MIPTPKMLTFVLIIDKRAKSQESRAKNQDFGYQILATSKNAYNKRKTTGIPTTSRNNDRTARQMPVGQGTNFRKSANTHHRRNLRTG